MRKAPALALALASGCVEAPTALVPDSPVLAVCGQQRIDGFPTTTQLSIAVTASGTNVLWTPAGGGSLMTQRLATDGHALGDATVAFAGTFSDATAAVVDDQVIVGAVEGDQTWMLAAPLGAPPYRELAIVGGIVGASPIAIAGGQRVTASVSYGGMLVNAFDDTWIARTSTHAVLTPSAREVAVAHGDRDALVVWPTQDTCYVEQLTDAAHGATWTDAGTCGAPRLASAGTDSALVFERDGDIYLARGAVPRASDAVRIGSGTEPRIVAVGTTLWLSYTDATGAVIAGMVDGGLDVHTLPLDGAATAHELAVAGGVPRVYAVGPAGLTVSALCTE